MPTTNTNFSTLITAIDTKAQSLAASTTDPKDLVFLGKTVEALNVADTVSAIITEGDTQVTAVNTAGTTQVAAVQSEGATQVAAVAAQGTNYAEKSQNLADLADTATALTNLGAADNNLSNLGNAATARSNLGITAITSTTPSDGQVLTYDAVTSAYVNRDASGGGTIDLGHAIDSYSLADVQTWAQANVVSDIYIKNDGVHSIQTSKEQFGLYGMFVSNNQNSIRALGVPFQVNQSTGAITVGAPNSQSNSSGTSISTTIAGDAGIGVGAIMGRQYYAGSYVIQYWALRFDTDNTVNIARGHGTDYATNSFAHPQAGFVGVIGNPVRGDDFSQQTGIFGFHGYGGSQGTIAADVIIDINVGSSAGANPSISNSGQGLNWSTSDSNTSTSGSFVADYLYTDTFDRIIFAAGRNEGLDSYKIISSSNNSTATRSSGPVKMPGESHYDRNNSHALAFTNGYHALYCMKSGQYHLYNTSYTKVGEGQLNLLDTGSGTQGGRYGTRRIGDNLFWVTGRYQGFSQIVNITVNTTTNKLEANVLGTINGSMDSSQYTAAYLTGTNNEYLVLDSGMFNVGIYDIGTHLDLSAY